MMMMMKMMRATMVKLIWYNHGDDDSNDGDNVDDNNNADNDAGVNNAKILTVIIYNSSLYFDI